MSIAANLDLNVRGNTQGLDKALDEAGKKVKAAAKGELTVDYASDKERAAAFKDRFTKEQTDRSKSYEGYKDNLKKQEAAEKERTKKQKDAVKERQKQQEQSNKDSKTKMEGVVTGLGSMFGTAISGITSGSLGGMVSGLTAIGSQVATMIGGPIGGAIADAVGAVVGVVVQGLEFVGGKIRDALTSLSSLAKAAKQLGTGTRELAGLQYAGQMAGAGVEEVNAALKGFTQNMNEAGRASGPSLQALARLQLRGKELSAMPLEQKLAVVADALKGVGNAADRSNLARGLGVEALLPALEQGSAGLAEMTQKARELGLGDPVAAKAAAAAQRAWRQLGASFDSVWNSLASALAPLIEKISKMVAEYGHKIAAWISDAARLYGVYIETAMKVYAVLWEIGKPLAKLIYDFSMLGLILGKTGITWEEFKRGALTAMFAVQWAAENWKSAIGLALDFGRLKIETFKNDLVHAFTVVMPKAIEGLGDAFEKIKNGDFKGAWEGLKDKVTKAMDRPKTMLEIALQKNIDRKVQSLTDFIAGKMKAFNEGTKDDRKPDGDPMGGIPKKTAAMEFGSKEAFSTMFGTQDYQAKAYEVANATLQENKAMKRAIERMVELMKGGKPIGKAKV